MAQEITRQSYSPETVWWEEIAGPASLLRNLEQALFQGKSVILVDADCLAFKAEFQKMISHWCGEEDVVVQYIRQGEMTGTNDPGAFLMEKYAPDKLTYYLRKANRNVLQDIHALDNLLVWIEQPDETQETANRKKISEEKKSWIRFLSDYRSSSIDRGLFILNLNKSDIRRYEVESMLSKSVCVLSCKEYTRSEDIRLFVSVLTEAMYSSGGELERQYTAELITSLIADRVELAPRLLERQRELLEHPMEVFCEVSGMTEESFGTENLEHCIWTAQLRVGFPLIEQARLEIQNCHYEEIKNALQETYMYFSEGNASPRYIVGYDYERITEPEDVDIGLLAMMTVRHRYDDPERVFLELPLEVCMEIRLLKDCRHRLAHAHSCSPDLFLQMLKLLEKGTPS